MKQVVGFRRRGRTARLEGFRSGVRLMLLLGVITVSGGCAAAVSTALAAADIRKGIAGLQQLVGSARSLPDVPVDIPADAMSPLAGTYRGFQAIDGDTLRLYVRTTEQAAAPIIDVNGNVTGYALGGVVATSLDSLEARVAKLPASRGERVGGRAMFFVEGTQAPTPGARALFPAAFLGRVQERESAAADRQAADLQRLDLDMQAPAVDDLFGRGIPHDLFGSVAEGVFTLHPTGEALYHQEYQLDEGSTLILHFERISRTALPGR